MRQAKLVVEAGQYHELVLGRVLHWQGGGRDADVLINNGRFAIVVRDQACAHLSENRLELPVSGEHAAGFSSWCTSPSVAAEQLDRLSKAVRQLNAEQHGNDSMSSVTLRRIE